MRVVQNLIMILTVLLLSGCGYNAIQQKDEAVTAAWSEVVNQYQRRADLVPNLVSTVQGYAQHEADVFTRVAEARSQVGTLKITPEMLNDPAIISKFQAAQGELSSALTRLMAVSENYPELKADGLFQNLQAQLEGTENRIVVARNRYVQAIQDFNTYVRSFPQNLTAKLFGYPTKANFSVENEKEISIAPKVEFNRPTPATN